MAMHAANVERSARLQRTLEFLRSRGEQGATSMEIQEQCQTVAPATGISELRSQGHTITCCAVTINGRRRWRYRIIEAAQRTLFALLLMIVPWSLLVL
jgi:hypothetical protein